MRKDKNSQESGNKVRRAAMYVRMSTDHQKYSTENQADSIREYATRHNIKIIETYTDSGKSGDGGEPVRSPSGRPPLYGDGQFPNRIILHRL